jgi:PleD family two-component response regulator
MPDQSPTAKPFVALIANDQEWSARSLDSILAPQGYTVIRAYTGHQALERARTARPDLVILDAQLPDIHGIEVCKRLRADPDFGRLTPIVITTAGPSGRAQRLAAYQAGAWEFYGQPLDGEALLARFSTFLEVKAEADALRQAALLDVQTGLYTVRGLARRVGEIGSEMQRHGRPLACVALTVASPVGSEDGGGTTARARLGELLREHGRASDAMAHLGGDEYLVVAPDTEPEGVRRMVARLTAVLEQSKGQYRLRAGYSAVRDFGAARIEPGAMMDRATAALRYLLRRQNPGSLLAFEEIPSEALPA